MTNLPEAKLAREAELCYATVAMVTDFDCWHPHHDDVTVATVVQVLLANAERARALVVQAAPAIGRDQHTGHAAGCACRQSLTHALITAPPARDAAMVERLRGIAGRLL